MKRVICVMLCMILAVSLISTAAFATKEEPQQLPTVGSESGITFKLFDYDDDADTINNNGVKNTFGFRGGTRGTENVSPVNPNCDVDGFGENHATVEPLLKDGYPVFDARGQRDNFSLGYLFGSDTNPAGEPTVGVTPYVPVNTLLRYNDETCFYSYDSMENACDYDTETNEFKVWNYSERTEGSAGYNVNNLGDFLPFNTLQDSQPGTHSATGIPYDYPCSEVNYWFGMTMENKFFIPEGKKINGEDMVFEFSGDDDVWVFVDDVLVLDLGGTHGKVKGSINFNSGDVTAHMDWTGNTEPSYPTKIDEQFTKAGKVWNGNEYTQHTLKFFYMERGADVANCSIRFNMPILPEGNLAVTKKAENARDDNTLDFWFVLKSSEGAPMTGVPYQVIGRDGSLVFEEPQYTDSNGQFSVKNKQTALFNLPSSTNDDFCKYYVIESAQGDNITTKTSWSNAEEGGTGSESGEFRLTPNGVVTLTCINTMATYKVTYEVDGVPVTDADGKPIVEEYAPGDVVPVHPKYEKEGFDVTDWHSDDIDEAKTDITPTETFVMPSNDVVLEAETSTFYYTIQLPDVMKHVEVLTGIPGQTNFTYGVFCDPECRVPLAERSTFAITTNGAGDYTYRDGHDGNPVVQKAYPLDLEKTYYLREIKGSSSGWTYDDTVYALSLDQSNNNSHFVTAYILGVLNNGEIERYAGNLPEFTNVYDLPEWYDQPSQDDPPVLDKENHYGYIIGYPVDYFTGEATTDQTKMPVRPEGNITRAEVATIFFRMLTDASRNQYWSQTNEFSDVAASSWYNAAISTLANAGVLTGYQDGTFRPDGFITRAEFATIASRFFEVTYQGDDRFTDISGHWAAQYINQAAEYNLVNGYGDGTFLPDALITRAEAVTLMNRTLDRHPVTDHLLSDMLIWPDNMDTSKWYYADMQEATNSHQYRMSTKPDGTKYEIWTKMLEIRDWAAFEREWSDANSAKNPGEVISNKVP